MAKRLVSDLDVRGKRVLVRVDFNVPLNAAGEITDDRRIVLALPTLRRLLDGGASLVVMSHLGRPKGDPQADRKYSLTPVARRLGDLLDCKIHLAPACVGPEVESVVNGLDEGEVCLLENLRFNPPETIKDKKAKDDPALRQAKDEFARQLASYADAYVNDAFGTCHRDNASMLTVPQLMAGKPRAIGFLIKKELDFLGEAVANPKRPFVAVLGGAKVSDKLGVIEVLADKCDHILIGGAMSYTFFAAQGLSTGRSLVEQDRLGDAKRLRELAGDKLVLPTDSVCATEIAAGIETRVCAGAIPDDLMGLDIGPQTVGTYSKILAGAGTVVWNGPMGVFETPPFDTGTMAVARVLAEATTKGAITVIGGGDSAAAIDKAGLADQVTHVSTGGGASLEYLEGKPFKALDAIDDA
ncbi:MAG: phosphoglycerate kinase [bacterium]|nr:phosphoglycerate kinase [bacterium]